MTSIEDLKNMRRQLYSMSIEEAEGEMEQSAIRAAVAALGQIEQRAKQTEARAA